MADDEGRLQSLTETLRNIDAVRRQREALNLGPSGPLVGAPSSEAIDMLANSAAMGAAAKLVVDQEKAMGETTRQTLERVVAETASNTEPVETDKPTPPPRGETVVSNHSDSTSTPFTVFDYLGLGFILEPPAVVVHAVMTGEPLKGTNALYALPFVALGAVFIFIGRNWASVKQKINGRLADAVDKLSRNYFVPFMVIFFALIGVAVLPIFIWPPENAGSLLPPTGNVWAPLTEDQKKSLNLVLGALPKRDNVMVICLNSDCKSLADNLLHVFHDVGWNPLRGTANFQMEPYGATLYQTDPSDQKLKDAIEKTTNIKIEHIVQSNFPNTDSIFLGVRP